MRNKKSRRHLGSMGYGVDPLGMTHPYEQAYGIDAYARPSVPAGAHPLYDAAHNGTLQAREREITSAFDAIEPVLRDVAAMQFDEGFVERAQSSARNRLGFEWSADSLRANWLAPLNTRALYAESVFRTFKELAERDFDRYRAVTDEGEPVPELIRKWGFHAVDVTPCADGRLSGVVDYILRIPPAVVVNRRSFAGAMFDIEEGMRHWAEVELRRHREGVPNAADAPTRYLKIGVYHFSGSEPTTEGCAAHGSDTRKAAQALLDRLTAFAQAIENTYCCGASVATLLIGVDTDNDAIRVHVPDARGAMAVERFIDNRALYDATRGLAREAAKEAIRNAVAEAAGVAPDDAATEGMRWFCGYLLKNNMAQIEYVRAYHNGVYEHLGHTERFIVVGDSFDDLQMRNLAFQAQMDTLEEGAADMDIGVKVFKHVNVERGLPIPVLVHFRYAKQVPGSRERALVRSHRLLDAINARYADLVREGWMYTCLAITERTPGSRLETNDIDITAARRQGACGCK